VLGRKSRCSQARLQRKARTGSQVEGVDGSRMHTWFPVVLSHFFFFFFFVTLGFEFRLLWLLGRCSTT
jgi:hypothetical protein